MAIIFSIIGGVIFSLFSLILFVVCLKRRSRRTRVKEQMYLKQVNMAETMGMSYHQMMMLPDRARTIHI